VYILFSIDICEDKIRRPEGREPLGGPRRGWKYIIKLDLREITWEGVNWIHLAKDRDQCLGLVNVMMNLRVP
jgi:hypothetical protein